MTRNKRSPVNYSIERRYLIASAINEWYETLRVGTRTDQIRSVFGDHKFIKNVNNWIKGIRPIPPKHLWIMYLETEDKRLLFTQAEKNLLREKGYETEDFPSEEDWPTIKQSGLDALLSNSSVPESFRQKATKKVKKNKSSPKIDKEEQPAEEKKSPVKMSEKKQTEPIPAKVASKPDIPTDNFLDLTLGILLSHLRIVVAALLGDKKLLQAFLSNQEAMQMVSIFTPIAEQTKPSARPAKEETSFNPKKLTTRELIRVMKDLSKHLLRLSRLKSGDLDRETARKHLVGAIFDLYEAGYMLDLEFPEEFGDLLGHFNKVRNIFKRRGK